MGTAGRRRCRADAVESLDRFGHRLRHRRLDTGRLIANEHVVVIEDAFLEKASVVWFWNRGRWHQLAGAN